MSTFSKLNILFLPLYEVVIECFDRPCLLVFSFVLLNKKIKRSVYIYLYAVVETGILILTDSRSFAVMTLAVDF